jgi:polyhydroxyalkanoate synthesis regulator protein
MQGMMGVPGKEHAAFVDLQAALPSQSKGLYDPKSFTPEMWTQFLAGQAPLMQGLMGNYLEQSKNLFEQMQEKVQEQMQAGALFPGIPAGQEVMPKK